LTGLFPSQLDNITAVFPLQEKVVFAHLAALLDIDCHYALRAVLTLTIQRTTLKTVGSGRPWFYHCCCTTSSDFNFSSQTPIMSHITSSLFSFQTQEPKVDYKSSAIAAHFLLLDDDDDDDHLMAGIGCLYQPNARTYSKCILFFYCSHMNVNIRLAINACTLVVHAFIYFFPFLFFTGPPFHPLSMPRRHLGTPTGSITTSTSATNIHKTPLPSSGDNFLLQLKLHYRTPLINEITRLLQCPTAFSTSRFTLK